MLYLCLSTRLHDQMVLLRFFVLHVISAMFTALAVDVRYPAFFPFFFRARVFAFWCLNFSCLTAEGMFRLCSLHVSVLAVFVHWHHLHKQCHSFACKETCVDPKFKSRERKKTVTPTFFNLEVQQSHQNEAQKFTVKADLCTGMGKAGSVEFYCTCVRHTLRYIVS